MFGERLIDLDELVLRCRNEAAKQYIAEAVACYRAGAFRASIVATWVAVVFDFLHKLDELALTGDAEAVRRREAYEIIRGDGNLQGSLDFERDMLIVARDNFQLISPIEFEDLERLKIDRHRCAHPSMISYDEIYLPSAELTRSHIRNAVTYLLQHPPVQGRAALDRVMHQISSSYFPTTVNEALPLMQSGPIGRPRRALLRNFIVVLLKSLLQTEMEPDSFQRYAAALNSTRELHRRAFEEIILQDFTRIVQAVEQARYQNIVWFLASIPDTWQYLPANIVHIVGQYVQDMPIASNGQAYHFLLDFGPLQQRAHQRLSLLNMDELAILIAERPRAELLDQSLIIYSQANSFEYANRVGERLISPLVSVIDEEYLAQIIQLAINNNQIRGSTRLLLILESVKQFGRISEDSFQQVIVGLVLRSRSVSDEFIQFLNTASVEQLFSSFINDEEYSGRRHSRLLLILARQNAILTEDRIQELSEEHNLQV